MAEYRQATQGLTLLAQRDLADFWRALNLEGDPYRIKAALLEFFPDLVQTYGDAAALLGADWYDLLRDAPPGATSFRATLAVSAPAGQADGSARWALGPLLAEEPDPAKTLALLSGATQRLVLQPFRRTVIDSTRDDTIAKGYARVPVGVTCRFCTMVASRGFIYATAAEAGDGDRWHDDCDCMVVPGNRRQDLPDDYDLEALQDAYARGEGIGRDLDTSDAS